MFTKTRPQVSSPSLEKKNLVDLINLKLDTDNMLTTNQNKCQKAPFHIKILLTYILIFQIKALHLAQTATTQWDHSRQETGSHHNPGLLHWTAAPTDLAHPCLVGPRWKTSAPTQRHSVFATTWPIFTESHNISASHLCTHCVGYLSLGSWWLNCLPKRKNNMYIHIIIIIIYFWKCFIVIPHGENVFLYCSCTFIPQLVCEVLTLVLFSNERPLTHWYLLLLRHMLHSF